MRDFRKDHYSAARKFLHFLAASGNLSLSASRLTADQQQSAPEASAWIGGQGTLPKEQKTQQWPLFGRSRTPQPVQS